MKDEVAHCVDIQNIKEYLTPINCFFLHNLSSNFHQFLDITKSVFKSSINPPGYTCRLAEKEMLLEGLYLTGWFGIVQPCSALLLYPKQNERQIINLSLRVRNERSNRELCKVKMQYG